MNVDRNMIGKREGTGHAGGQDDAHDSLLGGNRDSRSVETHPRVGVQTVCARENNQGVGYHERSKALD